jgi:hypothetical protein
MFMLQAVPSSKCLKTEKGVEMKDIVRVLLVTVLFFASAVSAAPLFPQCPPVGANTGCQFLITITSGGATVAADPNPPNNGPYEASEDALVGVINLSGAPVLSIPLSSTVNAHGGIFGFDGDGPCSSSITNPTTGCSSDPSGYGGPGVFFTNIAANHMSGSVTFNPPLANGASTWFGLEEVLADGQITAGQPVAGASPIATPALSEWTMILLGALVFLAGGWALRRRI